MYAWIVLLVVGVWNVIEGIVAIARSSFWTATGAHYVFLDLRAWGWIVLIWGAVLCLAALGVWRGGQLGRWVGIVAAGIAIIIQFLFLPAYPFWALIDIFMYSLVIYAGGLRGQRRGARRLRPPQPRVLQETIVRSDHE